MKDRAVRGSEDGPFSAIDPRLTVFALANGMDLAKGPDYRRLEWFSEGLERGILIGASDPARFDLLALAWRTGHAEERLEAEAAAGLAAESVSASLVEAIEIANGLKTTD